MIVANYFDAQHILQMIDIEDSTRIVGLIDRLKHAEHATLLSSKMDACIIGDPLGDGKWSMHILSKPEARGKDLWRFGCEAMHWMISDRKLEHALFFVKKSNKPLKLFLAHYGFTKTTDVGPEEILYIVSKEQIKQACKKNGYW